jgi:hypothetical protein
VHARQKESASVATSLVMANKPLERPAARIRSLAAAHWQRSAARLFVTEVSNE